MVRGWWGRQRLGERVRVVFMFVAVAVVAVGGLTLVDLGRANTAVRVQVDRLDPAAVSARDLFRSLLDQETGVRGFVISGREDFLQPYTDGVAQQQQTLVALGAETRSSPELSDDVAALREAAAVWLNSSAGPFIADVRTGQADRARSELASGPAKAQFDAVRAAAAKLEADIGTARVAARQRLKDVRRDLLLTLVALGVTVMAAGVLALVALVRWVSRPVARLVAEVRIVAGGDLAHRVIGTGPPDLVGLAADVEAMRERIVTELDHAVRAREALEQRGELVLRLREGLAPTDAQTPDLPHAARLIPAEGILAGDFYDLFDLDTDRIGLMVVDVAGHGADAGLFAYQLKALLSSAVRSERDPAAAFAWTAHQLGDTAERFATAVVAVLDTSTGRATYASAGHHPPIVLGRRGAMPLPPTGPLLGPLPGVWRTEEFELERGDLLVIFTDGLVEARDADGVEFGVEQLIAVLSAGRPAGPEAMIEGCIAAVRAHVGGRRLVDDCTIVILGWPDRRMEVQPVDPDHDRRARAEGASMESATLEVHLAAEPASVPLARALVLQTLRGSRWESRAVAVQRGVEELMGLAIERGEAAATLRIEDEGEALRCSVRFDAATDPDANSDPLLEVEADAERSGLEGQGGRAAPLMQLEALSDRWAVAEDGAGAVTAWFELAGP